MEHQEHEQEQESGQEDLGTDTGGGEPGTDAPDEGGAGTDAPEEGGGDQGGEQDATP